MRKYRGLTLDTKQWVEGSLWIKKKANTSWNKHYIWTLDCKWYEVDPETVGQEIGIKDKNGKEIYGGENNKGGDIVDFTVLGRKHIAVVKYHPSLASFLMTAPNIEQAVGWAFADRTEFIEIIGTMAEDSHLLEGE